MKTIKIQCTGEIEIDFHDLIDLQTLEDGRNLKKTDDQKIRKLADSIAQYGIVNNLQVWIDKDKTYCFDAHHRKKALTLLESEGYKIPKLPATRSLAKTIKKAKKLLLLKESKNSWIDTDAIEDFLSEIDFDIDQAQAVVEIPDFDWLEEINKETNKVKKESEPDTLFIVEIQAVDESEQEQIYNDLTEQGYKCKISIL